MRVLKGGDASFPAVGFIHKTRPGITVCSGPFPLLFCSGAMFHSGFVLTSHSCAFSCLVYGDKCVWRNILICEQPVRLFHHLRGNLRFLWLSRMVLIIFLPFMSSPVMWKIIYVMIVLENGTSGGFISLLLKIFSPLKKKDITVFFCMANTKLVFPTAR